MFICFFVIPKILREKWWILDALEANARWDEDSEELAAPATSVSECRHVWVNQELLKFSIWKK